MNICRLSAAVCLLFLLFAGSVYTEHGSFHVEEELGADLCPECKLLGKVQLEPTKVELDLVPVEPTAPLIQDEDLGAEICTEKVVSYVIPSRKPSTDSSDTDSYGVDMCPEKGQAMGSSVERQDLGAEICTEKVVSYVIPSRKPSADSSDTDSYGVDMCPEKGQPMGSSVERQDLGAEICTEKVVSYVIPSRKPSTDSSDTDSYGVDMCPKKGQPMGSSVERQVDSHCIDLATDRRNC